MSSMNGYAAGVVGTENGDVVRQLNSFLWEEIAAEVAYHTTAARLAADRDAAAFVGVLRQMEEEHETAARALREHIHEVGGEPLDDCGSLGVWADATHSLNGLFGRRGGNGGGSNGPQEGSALDCLRLAEENSLARYNSGMSALDAESAQLLTNLLIPTQRRHIRVLSELIGA